jgi:putative inorganic carbon (HCO3(-)) transporter
MSTTESQFRDTEYWKSQYNAEGQYQGQSDADAAVSHDGESLQDLPQYSQVAFPILCLFLLYMSWWYLQGSFRFPSMGAIRFEFILGATLSVIAVFKIITAKDNIFPAVLGWALAFISLMYLMTFTSVAPELSTKIFVDRVIKFIMMGVFIYAFICNPTALRWFLGTWLFVFAKMAQEGVLGLLNGGLYWENQGTMRLHGATPNYRHPNSFSGTQLATLPFLYFLFPHASRILKIVIAAQFCAALIVVLTTGSRTGYVALTAGALLLTWNANSRIKVLAVVGLIGFMAAPYIPQDYIDRAETIFTQQDEEGASIDTRKEIIDDALAIFQANKLGVGTGAFSAARKKAFNRGQDTHNLYLEVLTELGIQGLVLFTALIISCFKLLFYLIGQIKFNLSRLAPLKSQSTELAEHRADLQIMLATCFAITGFLVIRLALGVFGHDLFEIYWWFTIGFAVAISRMMNVALRRTDWFIQNLRSDASGEEHDTFDENLEPKTVF